jgi:predicted nucleotidyltransferase
MVKNEMIEQLVIAFHPYTFVFSTITGSHAFGYASKFSDYDVHGVHLLSAKRVLGLIGGDETIERKLNYEPEIDAVSHDLKKFIQLLIKGNGNILEDLYSPMIVCTSSLHEELKIIGKSCITKMCAAHYAGMAHNQQRRMQFNDVKKLLHTYRCLLMGIHIMNSGDLEMNIPTLAIEYHHLQVLDIIEFKQSGIEGLSKEEMNHHLPIIEHLYQQLKSKAEQSFLPDKIPLAIRDKLDDLLIQARLTTI